MADSEVVGEEVAIDSIEKKSGTTEFETQKKSGSEMDSVMGDARQAGYVSGALVFVIKRGSHAQGTINDVWPHMGELYADIEGDDVGIGS